MASTHKDSRFPVSAGILLGLGLGGFFDGITGAMDAGLNEPLFWGSLTFALVVAGLAAFPLNRWLIGRGRGHAVVHAYHGQ